MLPDGRLSTTPVISPIVGGKALALNFGGADMEDGGINLQDGSEGMTYQVWTGYVSNNNIVLDAPNQESPTVIYNGVGDTITFLSFTFDTNMNPCAVFKEDNIPKLLWYDSTIPGQVVDTFDWSSAVVFLDDKRYRQTGISDILLFYTESSNLYLRQQRDRFGIEYLLFEGVGNRALITAGMGKNLRLQIIMTG